MAPNASYSREQKKAIGSFYTPPIVSDFLAQLVASLIPGDVLVSCLDPAVGDGVLLQSLINYLHKDSITSLSGIDIDKKAISAAVNSFSHSGFDVCFKATDALMPMGKRNYTDGWNRFRSQAKVDGFDVIVCNPPWGADISKYTELGNSFYCAIGQFDIYDLFIELIIGQLNDRGIYGLILPDTVFSKEHLYSRRLLLERTSVSYIIKLGESFFSDVNSSVSIIVGRKVVSKGESVRCTHISPTQRKAILSGESTLFNIEESNHINVPQDYMISRGWEMVTDTTIEDIDLLARLDQSPRFKSVSSSFRGVELSKRGLVWRCPSCHKWSPLPQSNRAAHCSFCNNEFSLEQLNIERIIFPESEQVHYSEPITIGEDIHRYSLKSTKRIVLGYQGINYKDVGFFRGVKIVVRKTGVGISAAMDYNNHYTNQVVYIVKAVDEMSAPTELLMAVLNSRIITYYLIKSKSVNQWQTHPYITQEDIGCLPFPDLKMGDTKTLEVKIKEIKRLVRKLQDNENRKSFNLADAKLERLVAELFHFTESDYQLIYKTLESAQQMIPFRCLLDIKINDIWK